MTRDDLFNINAGINVELASACAKECPNAMYLVVSNPVNSIVPVWAETLKKFNTYNPNRLFGVTTLDISRANTFASERFGMPVNVPVVGGHAGNTIVPLFSLAQPSIHLEGEELDKFTHRVAFGGDEVVQAKAGGGSATLSMAAAGAKFCESVLTALNGEQVEEIAYVVNTVAEKKYGTSFFATEITLGPDGIVDVKDTVANASDYERARVNAMVDDLRTQIKKGIDFVSSKL
uniref:Malate dehydrogenase, mitochondrial n=1 Tax=Lygus hesperus TaxID=30085 RepID=A0A0A9WL12_LYGHE